MSRTSAKWLCPVALLFSSVHTSALVAARTNLWEDPVNFDAKVDVVLVPVRVLDHQGRAAAGLTRQDFKVFDKGKPQVISGFTVERRAGESSESQTTPPGKDAQAAANFPQPNDKHLVSKRYIALLFDDVHLSSEQLVHSRAAGSRMLSESLVSTDAAAVLSTSGRTNTGFTRDRARLQNAIGSLRASPVISPGAQGDCPHIDHYESFLIRNLHDPEALDAGAADAGHCFPGIDKQQAEGMAKANAASAMITGEQGTHITLDVVRQVVRQMGALPGQRSLILISPGFIAMMPERVKGQAQVTDAAATANVTVSTVDARGLQTLMMDISKSRRHRPTPVFAGTRQSRIARLCLS